GEVTCEAYRHRPAEQFLKRHPEQCRHGCGERVRSTPQLRLRQGSNRQGPNEAVTTRRDEKPPRRPQPEVCAAVVPQQEQHGGRQGRQSGGRDTRPCSQRLTSFSPLEPGSRVGTLPPAVPELQRHPRRLVAWTARPQSPA